MYKMPKVKSSLSSQLNNYVSGFGAEFATASKILYCKIYDVNVGNTKKFTPLV